MMKCFWKGMNDRHQLDDCLELMYALMQYRHEPVNRRLHKMGKRESMLHTDALQLIYHLARICQGCILEIGAFRGGSTVAAAWGVRDAGAPKKLIARCWLVIDDYGGPAESEKRLPTKTQVDDLVNAGQLTPLGYYGLGTWVGRWLTPPPGR